MKKIDLFRSKSGIGIIEILVAVGIVGIALSSLAGFGHFSLKSTENIKKKTIAVNLASEAIEAAKAVKDEDWNNIASLNTGADYHPAKSGSPPKWSFVSGQENINGFARKIIMEDVYRDADDNIVSSGGTVDPGTKKITSNVSWIENNASRQVVLTAYLTNWKL